VYSGIKDTSSLEWIILGIVGDRTIKETGREREMEMGI
jgi:hypothetical protein